MPPAWCSATTTPQELVGDRDQLAAGELALWTEGDLVASRAWFAAALRAAELSGDTVARAVAALGMTGLWADHRPETAESGLSRRRLRSALAGVERGSPADLRLRARLAADAIDEPGRQAAALAVAEQAVRSGDAVAAAEALSLAHQCLRGPAHRSVRQRLTSELVALAPRTGRRGDALLGLLWHVVDQLLDGDPLAGARLLELRSRLAARPHPAVGDVVHAIDGMLHCRAGRFAEAERVAREGLSHGLQAGVPDAISRFGAQLVALRWFQGRIAELLPALSELAGCPWANDTDLSPRAALALAAAAAGDPRQAMDALAGFGGELDRLTQSGAGLATLYLLVEAAHVVGDADLAARVDHVLTPFANLPVMSGPGISCLGSARQALGVAALTLGEYRRAATHLHEAIRCDLALGNRPAAVLARHRLADALQRVGSEDESRKQARTAEREARALGMHLPAGPPHVEPTPDLNRAQTGARSTSSVTVTCHRRGRQWQLRVGQRSVLVDDVRGMAYLAILIAHPHREIASTDLVSAADADPARWRPAPLPLPDESVPGESVRERFRHRLVALQQEIERCDEVGDRDASVRAHAAWSQLLGELNSITAFSTRDSAPPAGADLDRVAVRRAIRRALDRIEQADPVAGRALADAIQTGRTCAYHPILLEDVEHRQPDLWAIRPAPGSHGLVPHQAPSRSRQARTTPMACRVGSCLCKRTAGACAGPTADTGAGDATAQ
jgi:hypothetical protein